MRVFNFRLLLAAPVFPAHFRRRCVAQENEQRDSKRKGTNFFNAFYKNKIKVQRETVLQEINRVKEDYAYYVTVKKIADEAMKRCNFGKVSLPALWSSHFATF